MKKMITVLLAGSMLTISLCCTDALPQTAFAAEETSGQCGENVFWEYDEATALGSTRREERDAIVENMHKNGFTEEQIKLALGDRYNG